MPIREYECTCGKKYEELFADEYPKTIPCECGDRAHHRFSTFATVVVFRPGIDWGLGEHFDTARQRDNFLAKEAPNLRKVSHAPKGKRINTWTREKKTLSAS